MLRALLVDDEFPARAELRCILEEIGGFSIEDEFEDGEEALEMIRQKEIDVVFLDIQMRGKDGLAIAWEVIQTSNPPHIVFTTGYNEYAVKAFELNAVDYVMKPYSKERIEKTARKLYNRNNKLDRSHLDSNNKQVFEMLEKNLSGQDGKISVWASDRLIVIKFSEVFFVKAANKGKVVLNTEKGLFYLNKTIKDIEGKINLPRFMRTHKRFYVNTEKVREIIPWFNNTYVLTLEGCSEQNIPVSRHYIKEFNKIMGI